VSLVVGRDLVSKHGVVVTAMDLKNKIQKIWVMIEFFSFTLETNKINILKQMSSFLKRKHQF
jgi:hypothetical protein